jgi:hypothetical protein
MGSREQKMKHHFKLGVCLVAAVLLVFAVTSVSLSQELTGGISITVKDRNGATIPGATVTVTNTTTKQIVRSATTNEDGVYAARDVLAQLYEVAVSANGFKKHVSDRVQVDVGRHTNLFVTLEVGNVSEVVTVDANPVAVELNTATASTIVNGSEARGLSLNNRNWVQLITLGPGVSNDLSDQVYVGTTNPAGAAGAAGQVNTMNIAVNGARSSQNTYTIDGADVTDRGSNLTIQAYPSVDSISEFSVKRGLFTADSGRSGGGQINVVTRGGGNQFHGSVFEFLRNDKLNANDFLSNSVANPAFGRESNGKAKRAPFRYNNFGGTVSGPVYAPHLGEGGKWYSKPKGTYFFFSEEQRKDRRYPLLSATVPDANMRNGVFPMDICLSAFTATTFPTINPGNCTSILPAGTPMSSMVKVNPVAQQYLNLIYKKMPLPTDPASRALLGPALNTADFRQEIVRIDHAFNDEFSVYYRFEHDKIPTTDVNSIFSAGSAIPGVSTSETQSPGTTHTAQVTYLPHSNLVIVGRWNYGYGAILSNTTGTLALANSPITPVMAYQNSRDLVPQIGNGTNTNGFSNLQAFGNYNNFSYKHNFAGDVTWTKGSHTFKFGNQFSFYRKSENALTTSPALNQGVFTDFRNTTTNSAQQASVLAPNAGAQVTNPTQRANFQLFANFLLGNNVTFQQAHFDYVADMRQIAFEPYAQDEWRLRKNLTVNYGIRYSYFGSPYSKHGRLSNFDPSFFNQANAPQVAGNGTRIAGTGNFCNGMIVNSQNVQTAPNCTPAVSPYGRYVVNAPKTDFAPRFGIAWDPFGKGTTSIRTGYGIYYDQVLSGIYEQNIGTNPPYQETVTIGLTTLDQPVPPGTTLAAASISSIRAIQPEWKDPYMQHWSLEWQQMLGTKTLFSAGYFGSKGTHLIGSYELNELPPGYALTQKCVPVASGNTLQTPGVTTVPCQTPGTYFGGNGLSSTILDQIRPFRGYRSINMITPQFNSNYHSLQAMGQRRFSGSSQVNVAYTWSKNLTDNPTDRATAPQNSYDITLDYGRAALDRRHMFTANYIYEVHWFHNRHDLAGQVLGGWELSGIVTIQSGLPFTLTTNFDAAGLGNVPALVAGNRPNLLCDPNQNAPQTQQQYFNTSCVQPNPASAATVVANVVGNAARGGLNGPPTQRVDFSLFKTFRFGEGETRLQLRAAFFNVFNHTNFRTIQPATTSGTFGQVIAVRDPRMIQIGAKLSF